MNPFHKKAPDSIGISLPAPRMVRGYEIRRMPLGVYLRAMKGLNDFPAQVMDAVFPGQSLEDILVTLKSCDMELLGQMIVRALGVVPEEVLGLVACLTGISYSELTDDPDVGVDGLLEIINAWIEVNGLENFTRAAAALWGKIKGVTAASTGSSD